MAQDRRSRRFRQVFRSLLLVAALVAAFGATIVTARPVFAGSCSSQSGQSVTDDTTLWHWTTKWWCGNRGGAYLYGDAKNVTDATWSNKVAIMKSTWSWFVCWRRGDMHAGGNNIWYYTLGDQSLVPLREAWGYMPAVDVYTSTDPWPGMPQCPIGASPPARVDGLNKPVLFLHGFDPTGDPIDGNNGYWKDAITAYKSGAWPTLSGGLGDPITWCYYSNIRNCNMYDINASGLDRPIKALGQDLAHDIYMNFSRYGIPIDVVAHSMGGSSSGRR